MESTSLSSYAGSIFSKRFESIARWIVLVVLWVIILSIAVGKAGITNLITLTKERDILLYTVQQLSQENQDMENLFHMLSNSHYLQERYLKQNFGYVEQDEFVLQFNKSDEMRSVVDDKL